MKKQQNNDKSEEVTVNAAVESTGIREVPMPQNDERTRDEKGKYYDPSKRTREENRAASLGKAAQNEVVGSAIKAGDAEVAPQAEMHAEKEAWLASSEPERSLREQKMERAGRKSKDLESVPNHAIDLHRKLLAFAAKAGFVVGDVAVVANVLYRASTPKDLAVLLGVSLAFAVVMTGTMCGHEIAAGKQRIRRGPPPEGVKPVVAALYDSGNAEESYRGWRDTAYAVSGVMFVAIFCLSKGSGDPAAVALGYGLLGSTTVAGSACAEAYATNEAAEGLGAAQREFGKQARALKLWHKGEAQSAGARSNANLYWSRALFHGRHVATTVRERANRLTDTPEVGGYIDGGHMPVPEGPPESGELEVVPASTASFDRPRTRPVYSLGNDDEGVTANADGSDPRPNDTEDSGSGSDEGDTGSKEHEVPEKKQARTARSASRRSRNQEAYSLDPEVLESDAPAANGKTGARR